MFLLLFNKCNQFNTNASHSYIKHFLLSDLISVIIVLQHCVAGAPGAPGAPGGRFLPGRARDASVRAYDVFVGMRATSPLSRYIV